MSISLKTLLEVDTSGFTGMATRRVRERPYGWLVNRSSCYVTLQTWRIEKQEDGRYKCVVKVNKNYVPKYQYTLWLDAQGNEIFK